MSDNPVNVQPGLLAVELQTDAPCYFLELKVENVRSFGIPQTLDLSDGKGRPAQWVILLGDNGAGKTTLLQCLAAMIPCQFEPRFRDPDFKRYAPEIFLNPGDEKYRNFLRAGSKELTISIGLECGTKLETRDPQFQKYGKTGKVVAVTLGMRLMSSFDGPFPPQASHFLVYAYGATRRIGSAALSETRDSDPRATLFDENRPLLNAEEWLLQADYAAVKNHDEKSAERRDRIKGILIRLLPEVADLRIQTSGSQSAFVEALTPFGWVPMRALSSGYRSVVAWMVDLASRLFDRYPTSPDPLAEPAVVLVDQIDLLLHPKWQRELVQNLTAIFRNTQFIVTAHSPLIVQAATEAKIVLLRRENDHVVIDNRAESVRGWRLDQIVSSDLFENQGTRDPKTEELLKQRKAILTKPHISVEDKHALQTLDQEIGSLRFGETADEVRAMEIIERASKMLEGQKL
jgi:energy-coupling factor transporter ATP-binding protein EcfA2